MNSWLRDVPVNVKVAFAPVLGVLCLVLVGLIGGVANSKLNGSLTELTQTRMPQLAQVEGLGQRLAELNSAVNQSLAWEGAGFKAAKITALDQRIQKELARYDADLQAGQATQGLTPEQTELLAHMQQEFANYRKTAVDALDIKTGMLGNAASFMTVIDGHYAKLGPVNTKDARCVVRQKALSKAQNEAGVGPRRGFATPRKAFWVTTLRERGYGGAARRCTSRQGQ
jgi:methyl-accepting chemotaxis protein